MARSRRRRVPESDRLSAALELLRQKLSAKWRSPRVATSPSHSGRGVKIVRRGHLVTSVWCRTITIRETGGRRPLADTCFRRCFQGRGPQSAGSDDHVVAVVFTARGHPDRRAERFEPDWRGGHGRGVTGLITRRPARDGAGRTPERRRDNVGVIVVPVAHRAHADARPAVCRMRVARRPGRAEVGGRPGRCRGRRLHGRRTGRRGWGERRRRRREVDRGERLRWGNVDIACDSGLIGRPRLGLSISCSRPSGERARAGAEPPSGDPVIAVDRAS